MSKDAIVKNQIALKNIVSATKQGSNVVKTASAKNAKIIVHSREVPRATKG